MIHGRKRVRWPRLPRHTPDGTIGTSPGRLNLVLLRASPSVALEEAPHDETNPEGFAHGALVFLTRSVIAL